MMILCLHTSSAKLLYIILHCADGSKHSITLLCNPNNNKKKNMCNY